MTSAAVLDPALNTPSKRNEGMAGLEGTEPFYRLVTTILDPGEAPAQELAALYSERREIESALDECKTHWRWARIVLCGKTPDLARQEVDGLLRAHFAVRGWMHEAALRAGRAASNAK